MNEIVRLQLDVEIREVVRDDLAGFHEWYGPSRDESFKRSYNRHRAGEIVYLVAVQSGKPVGHLGVDFTRVRGAALLWQFGVVPPLQSLGIGSAMIRCAEAVAKDRGFAIVEIGAETDNPRARALYERLGFQFVAEQDDEWILRKDLMASAPS